MKKILSKITLCILILAIGVFLIYELYIEPLIRIKLDNIYEYIAAVFIMTFVYSVVIYLIKLTATFLGWLIDNSK